MKPMGITKVPLDVNGHMVARVSMTEINAFVYEIGGEKVTEPMLSELYSSCGMCGQHPKYDVSEEGVKLSGPCADVQGVTTVITLDVPSGKIVVDDDMRPMFNGFDHDGFADYNSARGQAQVIEAFAEDKCAFGPVGNSCPTLWKVGEDAYQIARMPYDDEEGSDTEGEQIPAPEGAQSLASICTDLWAYSIVDFDEWVMRGGDPEDMPSMAEIVEIPAGTYEFTHHSGETDFDDDADHVVWADIRRV